MVCKKTNIFNTTQFNKPTIIFSLTRWPWLCEWPATSSVSQSDTGQDHSPWECTIRVRVDDQREEDGTDEVEHYCRYSSLSQRKTHQGGEVICQPGKCDWQTWRLRSRHHDNNRQNKNSFCNTEEHLDSLYQLQSQIQDLQLHLRVCPALWLRDMADNKDLALTGPDIFEHLSMAWCTFNMRYPEKKKNPEICGNEQRTEEEVELYRKHPQETSTQHHATSSNPETTGKAQERPTSQQR